MSEQIVVENLPILYDPKIVELQELCKQPIEMFTELTLDEQINNYQEEPTERRTGIIEKLFYSLRYSEDNYKEISQLQFNGKIAHDTAIRNRVDTYYNVKVQQQAEEITMAIDALIQRDNWNPKRFGNYKTIKLLIDSKVGMDKALALDMLRLCALTAIPMDIQFATTQIIEPSITSPVRTQ